MKKLFLSILLSFIFISIFSQYHEINFEHLWVQQGLADNSINCIIQDQTGFIWAGGNNGLYKYDGYDFKLTEFNENCRNCPSIKKVFDIKEDKIGLLWILSDEGIVVFNPENDNMKLICQILWDSAHLKPDLNLAMTIDSQGIIWAPGQTGLIKISYASNDRDSVFNKKGKSIFNIEQVQLAQDKYSRENKALSIFEDAQQNLWVGCLDGLYLKKKGGQNFTRLDGNGIKKGIPPVIEVTGIMQFDENAVGIISDNNLCIISNTKEAISGSSPIVSAFHFSTEKLRDGTKALTLFKDKRHSYLLGTNKGLYKIKRSEAASKIIFDTISMATAYDNDGTLKQVKTIFEDRTNIYWVAHPGNGISKFKLIKSQFESYNNLVTRNINPPDINSLIKDEEGNLWIGANSDILYKADPKSHSVIPYNSGFPNRKITCIREKSPRIFLIGLYPGILEFNSGNGQFSDPLPDTGISDNLRSSAVIDMLTDNDLVYIATVSGLYIFNTHDKNLSQFTFNKNNSGIDLSNAVSSIIRLKTGGILISTFYHGINKVEINPQLGISVKTIIDNKLLAEKGIINVDRHRLFEDSRGVLWIANYSGLHSIDLKTKEVMNYPLFENIEFPQVSSITEDDHNNLWMGTHKGLCCFNTDTKSIKVFDKNDDLPIAIHGFNSIFKDKSGRLYFGGIGGIYSFHPDSLEKNDIVPPVVITDFRISNRSVTADTAKDAILKKNIAYTQIIKLHHNQNDLSFQFAALDYCQPLKNKYQFKLDRYQSDWITTSANNRNANYIRLKPGHYVFRVRGSNNEGVWNEKGSSVTIIIQRPWWTTFLAWALYVIMFTGTCGWFVYYRLSKIKNEKIFLENQVAERTHLIEEQKEEISTQRDMLEEQNQKILELNELRSRFFTNISHEFRTPLTLIQSPVEELLLDPGRNEKDKHVLSMVHRNTRRLMTLVNQLLDISKIDVSKMKLELVEADVMKHLKFVAGSFSTLAETKNINFQLQFPDEELITWFDADKLDKIAVNLLSNSFKFTANGGNVIFSAGYSSEIEPNAYQLHFSVSDTGVGIPADSLEKIFDRFYQVETSLKREGGGTGIGLSLSKDLAILMHGNIFVESEEDKGSTFNVQIPLGKEHLRDSEFILLKDVPETTNIMIASEKTDISDPDEEIMSKVENPILLIVEDNIDVRKHMTDNFRQDYIIYQAVDGISGLKKAIEIIPDLIITDLMMPGLDGLELCAKLKSDERTCHVPIIMLTAKVSRADKITGLQTGADDYIAKPFNMAELKVRAKNLIDQRKRLRERFRREITIEPGDISITPLDEKFLSRAIELVEIHIKDEGFDLSVLMNELNMSRSTLFRKLQALTDQSPTEFIRTIRLKRAASLLRQNYGNVTQVAMEAGFNNLSYFNRTFKKFFGVSPLEYSKSDDHAS